MPNWLAILIGVLGVAQMIYNVFLGLALRRWDQREREWQRREADREKQDRQREADLTAIRESCRAKHERLDARCDERRESSHAKEIAATTHLARVIAEMQQTFATREDVQDWRQETRQEFRRVFERMDKLSQDVASLAATVESKLH